MPGARLATHRNESQGGYRDSVGRVRGDAERRRLDCSCEWLAKQFSREARNVRRHFDVGETRCCRVKARRKPRAEHECAFEHPRWSARAWQIERAGLLIVAKQAQMTTK